MHASCRDRTSADRALWFPDGKIQPDLPVHGSSANPEEIVKIKLDQGTKKSERDQKITTSTTSDAPGYQKLQSIGDGTQKSERVC
jgi:hypothetical protein